MNNLEQIKKEYKDKFAVVTVTSVEDNFETFYGKPDVTELWNFISQKILETEKRVARETKKTWVVELLRLAIPFVDLPAKLLDEGVRTDEVRKQLDTNRRTIEEAIKILQSPDDEQFINSLDSKGEIK